MISLLFAHETVRFPGLIKSRVSSILLDLLEFSWIVSKTAGIVLCAILNQQSTSTTASIQNNFAQENIDVWQNIN